MKNLRYIVGVLMGGCIGFLTYMILNFLVGKYLYPTHPF